MRVSRTETGTQLKPFLWFTLYGLFGIGAGERSVKISTTELATMFGWSQQSASRHLRLLEQMGLVSRRTVADGSLIKITDEGMRRLKEVYHVLKDRFEGSMAEVFAFEGVVFSGLYEGAYYMSRSGYSEQIKEKLGFYPYPGTLNLRISEVDMERRRQLERMPAVVIDGFKDRERAFGSARCYPLVVNGDVEGALIVANRTTYDLTVMEVISPINLRKHFGLRDGDTVKVSISSQRK
jgi:riboflavin kinase